VYEGLRTLFDKPWNWGGTKPFISPPLIPVLGTARPNSLIKCLKMMAAFIVIFIIVIIIPFTT
jgi:hypothetical protein